MLMNTFIYTPEQHFNPLISKIAQIYIFFSIVVSWVIPDMHKFINLESCFFIKAKAANMEVEAPACRRVTK